MHKICSSTKINYWLKALFSSKVPLGQFQTTTGWLLVLSLTYWLTQSVQWKFGKFSQLWGWALKLFRDIAWTLSWIFSKTIIVSSLSFTCIICAKFSCFKEKIGLQDTPMTYSWYHFVDDNIWNPWWNSSNEVYWKLFHLHECICILNFCFNKLDTYSKLMHK